MVQYSKKYFVGFNMQDYNNTNKLGYDVSYISKWVNNVKVPNSRCIKKICLSISDFFIYNLDNQGINNICSYLNYEYRGNEELGEFIFDKLLESYKYTVKEALNKENCKNNECMSLSKVNINPKLQHVKLHDEIQSINSKNGLEMTIFIDLFTLCKEDKVHISNSDYKNSKINIKNLKFIFYINKEYIDIMFDINLILNMIENYSKENIKIYSFKRPLSSLIICVKDYYLNNSIVYDSSCLISSSSKDKRSVNEMFKTLNELTTSIAKPIFNTSSFKDIIENKYFIKYTLETNKKWILNSINQDILTIDLFKELLDKYFDYDKTLSKNLLENYMDTKSTIINSNLKILIPSHTLYDFLLNGEIRFFNKKMVLTKEERERYFLQMHKFFAEHDNIQIRLINGNFVEELKNFSNISIYLSDTINYITMELENIENDILIIKDKDIIEILNDFYYEVWENRDDIIIYDKKLILDKINYYLNCFKLLK